MYMNQGYQIIEPTSLEMLLGNPSQATLAVAILEWAIHRLETQFPQLSDEVRIEVIPVSYQGVYPAIGLRYKHDNTPDLGPSISNRVDTLVGELSVSDFISFVETSTLSWCDTWQELKEKT